MRGLAVTAKQPHPLFSSFPALATMPGMESMQFDIWAGIQVHKDTPDAVVNKLAAGMAAVSSDKGFIDKTTSLGIVPTARGPKEFAAFIKSEVETNTALLKEANFKPE